MADIPQGVFTKPVATGVMSRAVPRAVALAAFVNAAVFLIADAVGAFPDNVLVPTMAGDKPLGLGEIVLGSTVAIVAGGLVLMILARVMREPWIAFRNIAIAVLVLSLASPFTIENAPGDMVATLLLMHVLTAAVGVPALIRWARP